MFPYRLDRQQQHLPWMNLLLIILNVAVFSMERMDPGFALFTDSVVLEPMRPYWFEFITYQFLHGDVWHIGGNMLFLFIFGNAVEDRLRPLGYLAFYLAGGIAAGLVHCLVSNSPVVGASGSVAAVTGIFLLLFPRTQVRILFFMFLIFFMSWPSVIFIGLKIALDLVNQLMAWFPMPGFTQDKVAHGAHLGGYAFGLAVGVFIIFTRLLPREPFDIISMLEQRKRRKEFESVTRSGANPWMKPHQANSDDAASAKQKPMASKRDGSGSKAPTGRVWSKSQSVATQTNVLSESSPELQQLRADIGVALDGGDYAKAITMFRSLLAKDPTQVLPRRFQKLIANAAFEANDYALADGSYTRFLEVYRSDADANEIRLLLAVMRINYMKRPDLAYDLLLHVMNHDGNPERVEMAKEFLSRSGAAPSGEASAPTAPDLPTPPTPSAPEPPRPTPPQ